MTYSSFARGLSGALIALAACAPQGRLSLSSSQGPAPVQVAETPHEAEFETDRPDFTETPAVVPVGRRQVEAGETFGREDGVTSLTLGETLLRIGVARRVELRIATNSYALSRQGTDVLAGFEDASLGAKVALFEAPAGWRPQLGLIVAATLPTGAPGYSTGRVLPEVKVAAAWDLSERLSLGTNVNWSREADDDGTHDQYAASASFGYGLSERWGLYAEAFGFRERLAGWVARDYVNAGVTWKVTEMLQFDMRAGRRLGSPDFFTGFGLSHRW